MFINIFKAPSKIKMEFNRQIKEARKVWFSYGIMEPHTCNVNTNQPFSVLGSWPYHLALPWDIRSGFSVFVLGHLIYPLENTKIAQHFLNLRQIMYTSLEYAKINHPPSLDT